MAINAIQSSNPIDAATRSHNRIFTIYVVVLILTAVLTWLVWRSGNKVQEAVRADADARIQEARAVAAEAQVKAGKIEADNLELQGIVAGLQKQAADSEIGLAKQRERTAEADKSAAEAKLSLEIFKSPRTVKNVPIMLASLKPFQGTEYKFSGVGDNEECFSLLKEIDSLLQQSGWVRISFRGSFPAINVYGDDKPDISPTIALQYGVAISVENPEDLTSRPVESLPAYVRAAIQLDSALRSNIFPTPPGKPNVNTRVGTSQVIELSVGRKSN